MPVAAVLFVASSAKLLDAVPLLGTYLLRSS